MKFDVVMSNPPYNNGGYKEFIKSTTYKQGVFIVPANWQSLDDPLFNKLIINHSKVIKYYPDTTEVFSSIDQFGGISIIHIDRSIDNLVTSVINISNSNQYYNNTRLRSVLLNNQITLHNIGYSILSKIIRQEELGTLKDNLNVNLNSFGIDIESLNKNNKLSDIQDDNHQYKVINGRTVYGYISESSIQNSSHINEYKLCMHERVGYGGIPDKQGKVRGCKELLLCHPSIVASDATLILYTSPNKQLVLDQFKWISTKFTRFLFYLGNMTSHFSSSSAWRFAIAKPSSLIYNYTEFDIYSYFNLSSEEASCIEYTIKPMDLVEIF